MAKQGKTANIVAKLCYCKPGITGHVLAAKVGALTWARGVLAIEELTRGNMAIGAPRLTAHNRKLALAIIARAGS